jgi:serine protease Do
MNSRILGAALLMLALAAAPDHAVAQAPESLRQLNQSFYQLTQELTPAVVQILSNSYSSVLGSSETAAPVALQQSTGSGAILSADGLIVTNAHVVSGATRVRVRLSFVDRARGRSILRPSGKLLPAKIIGIDNETDIALIKVDAENLPFLKFTDSDAVRQGQIVLALGNPMGLENSVTMGVVSSVARQLDKQSRMVYIQTDTAINPGNSGGPLVDIDGAIVGINTMIVSRSGGSEGLGFAVPSNIAASVIEQLSRNGIFTRGDIGVSARTVTPTMVEALNLPSEHGVILEDVYPDSPAFRSGLRIGDIVLALDGKPMENGRQFHVNVYGKRVNSVVDIELLRNGETLTKKVVIQPRADDPVRFASMVDDRVSLIRRLGVLGIAIDRKVQTMLPNLRRGYGILVARMALTATGQLGLLLPGDVIYTVNGQPVSTLIELRGMLDQLETDGVIVLQIERGGKIQYLEVPLD